MPGFFSLGGGMFGRFWKYWTLSIMGWHLQKLLLADELGDVVSTDSVKSVSLNGGELPRQVPML